MIYVLIFLLLMILSKYLHKLYDDIWYKKLPTEEKTMIKELELKLTDINPTAKKKLEFISLHPHKQLNRVLKNLIKDEEIIYFTTTKLEDDIFIGYIYVTNKRVFVIADKAEKSVPLEKIISIETGKKWGKNWLKIKASYVAIQLNKIPRHDILKLKEEINNGMQKYKNVSINITQTTQKDIADKISRLRVLYEEGVLTEYEFNMKKMELLDKIN